MATDRKVSPFIQKLCRLILKNNFILLDVALIFVLHLVDTPYLFFQIMKNEQNV